PARGRAWRAPHLGARETPPPRRAAPGTPPTLRRRAAPPSGCAGYPPDLAGERPPSPGCAGYSPDFAGERRPRPMSWCNRGRSEDGIDSWRGSNTAGVQPGRGSCRHRSEPPLRSPPLAVSHLPGRGPVALRSVRRLGGPVLQGRTLRPLSEPLQLAGIPRRHRGLRHPHGHLDLLDPSRLPIHLLLLPQGHLQELPLAPAVVCRPGAEPRYVPG